MKTKILLTLLTVSVVGFSATQRNYCDTADIPKLQGQTCKNVPGNRRDELGKKVEGGNPVAVTLKAGSLAVYYTTAQGLQKCTITDKVSEVKMSSNSGDLSTAYFIREGALMDVKMSGRVAKGACPKAEKQNYSAAKHIDPKYDPVIDLKVSGNANSYYTAVAVTKRGNVILSTDTRIEVKYFGNAERAKQEAARYMATTR